MREVRVNLDQLWAPGYIESDEEWIERITGPGGVADTQWFDRAMSAYAPGQVEWLPKAIENARKAIGAPT